MRTKRGGGFDGSAGRGDRVSSLDAADRRLRFGNPVSKKMGFEARTGIPTAAYEMVAAKDIFLMMAPPGMFMRKASVPLR